MKLKQVDRERLLNMGAIYWPEHHGWILVEDDKVMSFFHGEWHEIYEGLKLDALEYIRWRQSRV
jgi:hypothetical protein